MKSYNHAVPGPNEVLAALEEIGVPASLAVLQDSFDISGDKPRKALKKQLSKMVARGHLMQNRRGEYCLLAKLDALTGKVSGHPDGFGFFIPDDGSEDIYMPFHEMRSLLDGDRVAVRVGGTDRKGRRKGAVVEILERARQSIVGMFHSEHGIGYVTESAARTPHHFLVAPDDRGGAKDGQLVKLEITDYPTERREAQGRVVAILGSPDDPGMLTALAIESFGLRDAWPGKVMTAAKQLGTEVAEADKQDRTDLREVPLVTIDGADARDFDDAVYAEQSGEGWRLLVAIADVSHYVSTGNAIDKEAVKRGTSTYFPDRVVPMLPEALSNGLCSLNPNVDRLCVVCEMRVSKRGKVERSKFYKAVMRSHARLTYGEVNEIACEREAKARERHPELLKPLDTLYALYKAFEQGRRRRGALDLELPEVRITMSADNHHVDRVAPLHRNDAHKLIEECMIAANVQAAKFLRKNKLPTLYRVHPKPEIDRFEELRVMLQELGYKVAAEARTEPRALNKVLAEMHARPDFPVLATAVLRTFAQAIYTPVNEGHFGLALDAYAHFTSPIRRYPDLLVHRGISHLLEGGKPGAFRYKQGDMEQLGRSCSMLERQAEAASRHVENRYKCIYIQEHVGGEYDGVITGVTHFGLFVMLSDFYVEGLVHVTSLGNDYYHSEHGGLRLTGEHTGTSFGLGDTVRVKVARVDVEEARVDLQLVVDGAAPDAGRGKTTGGKTSKKKVGKKVGNKSGKKTGRKTGRKAGGNKAAGKKGRTSGRRR